MVESECKRCVNSKANPAISINSNGLCKICELYQSEFQPSDIQSELEFFKSMKDEKIMVGISGGKDSTATLYTILKMGFKPIAFTFDIGYYPQHIFSRAKKVAQDMGVPYRKIDIRSYIRKSEKCSYTLTARLYETCDDPSDFSHLYQVNRKEYSVKSYAEMAYVRACQICRKTVIQAYYGEALKCGAKAVILGMNEWAGLSKNKFSAIRKLSPPLCTFEIKPVYIVHLPFLLQHKIDDTAKILSEIGWKAPEGELLVESNANSCLFARATEKKAKALLGFHPDSTRLAREVTVGFITKDQAKRALSKENKSDLTVKQVLEKAGVLWKT